MTRSTGWTIFSLGIALTSASSLQASGPTPAVPEMSEEEICSALVPDEADTIRDPEFEGPGYYREVVDVVETDFGVPNGRYLVAVVYWVDSFPCNSCRQSRLAVFELPSKRLIWQLDSPPARHDVEGARPTLRIFRRMKSDPLLTLAYDHFAFNCLECGGNKTIEVWFQPRLDEAGRIQSLATVWTGALESGNSGRRGGTPYDGCGQMIPLAEGRFEYLTRAFVGAPYLASADRPDVDCQDQIPTQAVEFRRSETWQADAPGGPLRRVTRSGPVRIDHAAAEGFPFSLPVRDTHWRLVDPDRRRSGMPASPSGRWFIERLEHGVALRQAKDETLIRVIDLEESETYDRSSYDIGTYGIGWSADSTRFFVVGAALPEDFCLLSFSVSGADDYWEGVLDHDEVVPPDHENLWSDGFILERAVRPPD